MPIPSVPSQVTTILATGTYDANWFSGTSIEQKIQAAINRAALDGAKRVLVHDSYDVSLVTHNTAVKMVREGGNWQHYDIVAYGGRQLNGSIAIPLRRALAAAVVNGGGFIDLMTPFDSFVMLDSNMLTDIDPANVVPVTFLWGNYEVRIKSTQTNKSNYRHIFHGTQFISKDENGNRVLGTTMFNTQEQATTANCTSGSANVVVASADYLQAGQLIGLHGHVPRGGTDNTTLNGGIGSSDVTITVVSTTGFWNPASGLTERAVLRIENEVITYTGLTSTTFTGCVRGAMGSTAASHSNGVRVDRAVFETYRILSVSGITVTVDVNVGVTGTAISAVLGSQNVVFDGAAILDGNRDPANDDTNNPFGIYSRFSRNLRTGRDLHFKDIDHGGVQLQASMDCVIDGHFERCSRYTQILGSHVWLFGNCKNNYVTGDFYDGATAVAVDDRSSNPEAYDNNCDNNIVVPRVVSKFYNAFVASGCNFNYVYIPVMTKINNDGVVFNAPQWVTAGVPTKNYIEAVVFSPDTASIRSIDASTLGGGSNVLITRTIGATSFLAASASVLNDTRVPLGVFNTVYSTDIPVDFSFGDYAIVTVANATAFAIQSPNPPGQGALVVTFEIFNNSGGVMGTITWGARYKLAGAFTNPADTKRRTITFHRNSNNDLIEISRSAADI